MNELEIRRFMWDDEDITILPSKTYEKGTSLTWEEVSVLNSEWARKQLSRRETAAKARCAVQGCTASPTQLVSVKGAVLPYCDEHLPGAKDVLARHSIKVEGVRSAEQVWVDAKGFFFKDENGRTVFAGGPGSGGGSTSSGATMSDDEIANTRIPEELIPDKVYVGLLSDWYEGFEGMRRKPVVEAGLVPSPKGGGNFTHEENRVDSVYVSTSRGLATSYANLYSRPLVLEIDVRKLDKSKFYYDPLDPSTLQNPIQMAYRGTIPPDAITPIGEKEVAILGYDEKQEHTGAILALKPPAYIADEVAVEGGLSPTELHVTLVYLGETADLNKDEILILAERLAQGLHPFTAKLDGTIRFAEGAVALNVNSPYIPELRQQLVETLRGLGHEVTDIHGFTPHLTIKYVEPDERFDDEVWLPDEDVEFNELWLFWGGEQVAFPLLSRKENESEAQAEPALLSPTELDTKTVSEKTLSSGDNRIGDSSSLTVLSGPVIIGYDTSPTERDTKAVTPDLAALAAAIAERAGGKATADDVQRDLLEPWLTTVFGTPASNQMQKVAARTFGFPDPPGMEELKINWQLLYPMGEMYNITQEYLAARGFKEWETVPVYRPYVPSEARPKQWQKGDEVRIKLLPLTSWTLDISEAVKVAEFLGAPGSPAFVLKTFIPIKSVVSTPNTGIGLPGTQEVVCAGGEYMAVVEQRYE